MGKAFMPTMGVAYPIESINRKLALRSEKAGLKYLDHGNGQDVKVPGAKYMGGMTRSYGIITGSGKKETVKVQYLFIRKYARTTPPSVQEIDLHNNFATISRAVTHILEDLTQVTRVQQMYLQARADVTKKLNGVSVLGYANVRAWIFGVQYAGLKASGEYNVNTFPSNFDA